jgi:hypothetical protein
MTRKTWTLLLSLAGLAAASAEDLCQSLAVLGCS